MALLFHRLKVVPPVKGVCWMKIVNKTSFEHVAPPGVDEYKQYCFIRKAFIRNSTQIFGRLKEPVLNFQR